MNFFTMYSYLVPKLQGSWSNLVSLPALCVLKNGWKAANCTQRVYNSPSGSPINPPTSLPQNDTPEIFNLKHC